MCRWLLGQGFSPVIHRNNLITFPEMDKVIAQGAVKIAGNVTDKALGTSDLGGPAGTLIAGHVNGIRAATKGDGAGAAEAAGGVFGGLAGGILVGLATGGPIGAAIGAMAGGMAIGKGTRAIVEKC